jgi:hypothetical protein
MGHKAYIFSAEETDRDTGKQAGNCVLMGGNCSPGRNQKSAYRYIPTIYFTWQALISVVQVNEVKVQVLAKRCSKMNVFMVAAP